jgi:hypothetical protein
MTEVGIAPPADDRLGVLSSTAHVVREGRLVRLQADGAAALAARWARAPWPEQPGLGPPHLSDGTERMVNWVLLLDALNFCFWDEPDEPRWRVALDGGEVDGYYALAAALSRAVAEGHRVWDAGYLAALDARELGEILRPAPGSPPIPLFEARLANAREVGRVLLARYAGRFAEAIAAAGGSAVELALLLAREFASFDDVAVWRGRPVRFYKRAQICVADLHAAFAGARWGAFADLDRLTAFADYKLPQLLRALGVLEYAPELAARVDAYAPIAAGSEEEVEIRAETVWAVEWLRQALAEQGVRRTASAIDYRLWLESQGPRPDARPYHRTRTIYY